MRRLPGAVGPILALLLAACGDKAAEAPEASVQRGLDRSVADVRAAEAAMVAPVLPSQTIAELTRPAPDKSGGPPKERRQQAEKQG